MIGLCSALLFWPIMLTLALTGLEKIDFQDLPIAALLGALLMSLGKCSFIFKEEVNAVPFLI